MSNEQVVADVVRAWVGQTLPGDRAAANRAAHVAQAAYAQGASVTEACRRAQAFVGSWVRHPCHLDRGHVADDRLAS